MQTAVHFVDDNGITRATGTRSLKGTQAYPLAFGICHGQFFNDHFVSMGGSVDSIDQSLPASAPGDVDDMGCFGDLYTSAFTWYNNIDSENVLPLNSHD